MLAENVSARQLPRLRHEATELRHFNPACVAVGSKAEELRASTSCPLYPQKRSYMLTLQQRPLSAITGRERMQQGRPYSIASSARASRSRPSARAARRRLLAGYGLPA